MNVFEQFETKPIVEEGKWFPLDEEAAIKLFPMRSDYAQRKFQQLMEPFQPRIKAGGELTEEELKRINLRFFTDYIILDWKGLKDKDGKDIKFSKENCMKLLEALPRFFSLIVQMAADEEAFQAKQTEEDEGNSSAS